MVHRYTNEQYKKSRLPDPLLIASRGVEGIWRGSVAGRYC